MGATPWSRFPIPNSGRGKWTFRCTTRGGSVRVIRTSWGCRFSWNGAEVRLLDRIFRRSGSTADAKRPVSATDGQAIREVFNRAASDDEHYPTTIEPRSFHVKLVLGHLGDLAGKRVADVGCGKGRFARILAEKFPSASIYALDL